ncbi:hypothetical protein GCM10028807_48400 [Spirosoma daeguense]
MNFTRHLFAQTARGLAASLAVCVLMAYGISGIIYFTTELAYSTETSFLYTLNIVGSNGIDALVALSVCQLLIPSVSRLRWQWMAYSILGVVTFGTSAGVEQLLWMAWQKVDPSNMMPESIGAAWVFKVSPVVVALLYYYGWRRFTKLGQTISDQAFQLLQLERMRTKAELDALQARINPHFLYNALNSIASLVRTDSGKAEKMTLLLAKLFRYTTDSNESHLNSIRNELDIVRTYLEIEQVRFGDRLSYSVWVDDTLQGIQVPRFVLQPIVENAVKHGISKTADTGQIGIQIYRDGTDVVMAIHDSGPPFADTFSAGYGLQSIQDKLRLIYGSEASLEIENGSYKQVVIRFVHPTFTKNNKSHENDSYRRRTASPRPADELTQ